MKPDHTSRSGCRGFSLIELVAVLGVLAILAGIGASGLRGVQVWMRERASAQLFMELQTACRLYQMERGDWPASLRSGEIELNAPESGWREALAPYLERPVHDRVIRDGFGNERILLVVDVDGDRWIEGRELAALPVEERPTRLWARVAVYSLDEAGKAVAKSWSHE
jgi:prepilin-type N-terminal cleavage/methylation domain-containing protein